MPTENPPSKFLTAKQARARYGGVSNMWLHRMLKDKKSGFPAPVRLNKSADPDQAMRVCTENLSSGVVVVKSAKDRV